MFEENVYVAETAHRGKSLFAKRNFKKGHTIFVVCGPLTKKPTIYTIPIDFNLYLDPLFPGKYLCHSCEPNCGIKNRTEIVAMQDIKKDDEITIDYAMIVPKYDEKLLKQELKCKCGSPTCRRELGSYAKLSKLLKKKYAGFISDYLIS